MIFAVIWTDTIIDVIDVKSAWWRKLCSTSEAIEEAGVLLGFVLRLPEAQSGVSEFLATPHTMLLLFDLFAPRRRPQW